MAKEPEEGLIEQANVPQTSPEYQKPQAQEDRQGPTYDNDVPNNWLRGMGKSEACGKPGFDSGPSGSRYGK